MIQKLRPYPKYKDSGVPWLGKVPVHWEVLPNRAVIRLKKEIVGKRSDDLVLLSLTKQGIIARDMENPEGKFPTNFDTYQVVEPGDLIFCLFDIDETPRTVGLSTLHGMITGAYTCFACPDPLIRKFVYLLYLSLDNGKLLKPLYSGLRKVIQKTTFLSAKLALPPQDEQTAIVRFLDWADSRIRRVIRAREKRIKLLEEYKQALINQAVTGKIDVRSGKPYPKYKDSGIEWLGKVPEHWEVRRLKSSVAHINEQTNVKNPDELYIALEHVESWTGRLRAPAGDVEFDSQVKRFRAGDVLFGKLRPYLAKVVRPEQDGVCVGEFFVLRPKYAVTPRYLEVVLRSLPAIDFINSSTYGAKMPRADWTFVGSMLFPHPPITEQTAIVEFLDVQTERIDAAIAADRQTIDLLKEFRTRLVADVVTGKLDVREAAAKLPDEPPGEEATPLDEKDRAAGGEADLEVVSEEATL